MRLFLVQLVILIAIPQIACNLSDNSIKGYLVNNGNIGIEEPYFSLNNDLSATNQTTVPISINAPSAIKVTISHSLEECESSQTWQNINQVNEVSLLNTNSANDIYVKFKYSEIHFSSCIYKSIVHDTLDPIQPSGVQVNKYSVSGKPVISLTESSDLGLSGIDYYEARLLDASFEEVIGWTKFVPNQAIDFGQAIADNHRVEIRSVDKAGNTSAIALSNLFSDSKSFKRNNANVPRVTAATTYDFDSDGDMDIIVYSADGRAVYWLENTGTGDVTPHLLFHTHHVANKIFAEDMDGDGDVDIFLGHNTGGFPVIPPQPLVYWENKGSYFHPQTLADPLVIDGLDTGDIDGDGDIDLCTTKWNDHLAWFERTADHQYIRHDVTTGSIMYSAGCAIGDIDGDGKVDIASAIDGDVVYYKNDGSQNFSKVNVAAENAPVRVRLIDFNFDGHLDIVYYERTATERVYIQLNDGSGNLTELSVFANNSDHEDFADFDKDGQMDIVAISYTNIMHLRNNGNGTFTTNYLNSIGITTQPITTFAIDINNDTELDIFAIFPKSIPVYINDGSENFSHSTVQHTSKGNDFMLSPGFYSVEMLDLNQDGNQDILGINYAEAGTEILMMENVIGNFKPKTLYIDSSELLSSLFAVNVDPSLNSYPDLVVSRMSPKGVLIFKNDGTGNITKTTLTTSFTSPLIAIGDLNGDGYQDVIVSSITDRKMSWYRNNGSGAFTHLAIVTSSDDVGYPQVVDIDGVNGPDILVVANGGSRISWWQNNGSGSFTRIDISTTETNLGCHVAGDFNGDGNIDLLGFGDGPSYARALFSWENDGSQNFTKVDTGLASWHDTYSCRPPKDVNLDGNLDGFNFYNDGLGNFQIGYPLIKFLTDINGDGHLDEITNEPGYLTWAER